MLLKSKQKENVIILSAGLKDYADQLHEPSHKGHATHDQMHETLEKIEVKFSTLSTAIGLLQ